MDQACTDFKMLSLDQYHALPAAEQAKYRDGLDAEIKRLTDHFQAWEEIQSLLIEIEIIRLDEDDCDLDLYEQKLNEIHRLKGKLIR